MNELEKLRAEYFMLLQKQVFIESDLDYSILEKHKPFLEQISRVSNSGLTVFDMFRKTHAFTSYNFSELFGHDMEKVNKGNTEYFDSKVHPQDLADLMKCGIRGMKFYYEIPAEERANYKMINEYRIEGKDGKYIRVIEQQQALETDRHGNIWLALGVIDISPNQSEYPGIKSQMLNFRTGDIVNLEKDEEPGSLSRREKEILSFIKEGYLSKEISSKLAISIHTVNTHRQRILEKLNVYNSMEAVSYASRFGLID